ncbi:hypothetical protein [Streptococcus catagoni]|uniref:hypothetical protein n=1 Tax=Streptococcus catagoni TaxID=2654874 RepID=UPI00140A2899|nr:hypothetical protein [Streptococcus catagoni]
MLNHPWKKDPTIDEDRILNENRAATQEEISAFYAGDSVKHVQKDNRNEVEVTVDNQGYQTVTVQDPYSVS